MKNINMLFAGPNRSVPGKMVPSACLEYGPEPQADGHTDLDHSFSQSADIPLAHN